MAMPDDAFDTLRRARPADLPGDLASPTSAAAQALLEEIASMPVETAKTAATAPPESHRPTPRRRRRARFVAAAVAAAAVVTAAFVVADRADDDPVRTGPQAPGEPSTRSGRLTQTWDLDWKMVTSPVHSESTTEWSGNARRIVGAEEPMSQYVEIDGRAWGYFADITQPEGGDLAKLPHAWSETNPLDSEVPDPALLADKVGGGGPFTALGDEEIDGVPTHHQRAAHPDQARLAALGLAPFYEGGVATELEIWVDDDGLVRRLDVEWQGDEQGKPFTETRSLVFTDLGEPITIEPPKL